MVYVNCRTLQVQKHDLQWIFSFARFFAAEILKWMSGTSVTISYIDD